MEGAVKDILERRRRHPRDNPVTPGSVRGSVSVPSARPVEEIEMTATGDVAVGDSDGDTGALEEGNLPFEARNKWTALRVWSVFGFATCTVPWYLAYDDSKKEYGMKSHWIQMIFCIMQYVISTMDALRMLKFLPGLLTNATPFTYIHIGGLILAIVARIWFAKVVFLNKAEILSYHQNMSVEDVDEMEVPGRTNTMRPGSSAKRIGMTSAFVFFALLMIGADFGMKLKEYDDDWKESGLPVAIQYSACFARKTFLWRDHNTCGLDYVEDKISDLPASEISLGVWGVITFVNAKMAHYQKFIVINVCNWTFYFDAVRAMWIIQNTDQPAIPAYDNLKTVAERLSGFGGILMFLQLMEIATNIPRWSGLLLLNNAFASVYVVSIAVGFFPFIVLGCWGALISEKMKDELAGPRGQSSRPSTPRQMSAFLFRLIRSDVGIGISGIYVLNFGFLVAYMSVVGTFIMVLYEVTHNDKN